MKLLQQAMFTMFIFGVALIVILLAGCAVFSDPRPFIEPPRAGNVCLAVDWVKPLESCGGADANGCATRLGDGFYRLEIPRPRGWGDARAIETMGHELAHALGATHE